MKLKFIIVSVCLIFCVLMQGDRVLAKQNIQDEKIGYITDVQFQGVVEEMVKSSFTTFSRRYDLNWKISKNKRCYTTYFAMNKGQAVSINITLTRSGMSGIIGIDGKVRYVEGTSIYHVFNITKSMNYCVFIQNKNNVTIYSNGFYTR